MLTIRIVAVGGLKEKFWSDAIAEYQKRLGKYCRMEIVEIRESNPRDESREITTKLRGHVILCDINGPLVTSDGLSARMNTLSQTTSAITFVVGGSDGVHETLSQHINERMSFGRITLPHQLFRVILIEQIYRAQTITRGEKYHK
ncbi:MAG: 23S rRNA (pseudouridine(1915)-N(3))-methyltransferase RlmH [Firmicutes bacterium]|nr:23S rRNA (pseudouridine(1915)-N(3))-methyltransferase RlmH [Bacillota bacterium]